MATDEQLAAAPQLEPAFEHLLRNSSTHESVINTLRVNEVVDRDTFVNMFDSESSLKDGASDLGFRSYERRPPTQTRVRQGCNSLEDSEDHVRNKTSDRRRGPCARSACYTLALRLDFYHYRV